MVPACAPEAAAPVIPVARITERVAVKTSGNEIVQAVEILRGERIGRELDVSDGHVGGTELRMSGECVMRGSQAADGRRCLSGIMRGSQAAGGRPCFVRHYASQPSRRRAPPL